VIALQDSEIGQRAYLLSREPEFLRRYTDSIAHVEDLMLALEAGTADDPRQREPVATLRQQVAARQEMLLAVALERAGRGVPPSTPWSR
jgi:CHASE3 domain sensor protein